MNKIFFPVLFLFLLANGFCQQEEKKRDVNTEFDLAVNLFEKNQFNEALKNFKWIAEENSVNNKTSASYLFIGKILLKQTVYDEAEIVLRKFINDFPESNYLDEAKLTLSDVLLQKGEPKKAAAVLLDLVENFKSLDYKNSAKDALEQIIYKSFYLAEVKELTAKPYKKELLSFLYLVYGKYQLIEKQTEEAKITFRYILDNYYDSDEYLEALKFYGTSTLSTSSVKHSDIVISVLLPLSDDTSGTLSATATEVLEGIKFACDEFNNLGGKKIGLLIKDTRRSKEEIIKLHDELKDVKSISAIIGPLYSDETKYVAELFNNLQIPVITPTATDDDLSIDFPNLFQANPTFEMRGRAMAQYIFFVENKKNIAILASSESYSNNLTSSFKSEFEKLGGQIIVESYFPNDALNITPQLSEIKNKISSIEGIYSPISDNKSSSIILSSLLQAGISLPIYANQDWFKSKGLETTSTLSNKLTLTSDYFIDYRDKEYIEFNKKFSSITNMEANRNVLYGYDVTTFVIGILTKNLSAKNLFLDEMTKDFDSVGFHNNICFHNSHINRFLNIIRYKDGKFELIDKFKVEN